jgi:hypothetical protein
MQKEAKESLFDEFLKSGRYFAQARRNNVSDSAVRQVAERLGFLTEAYDANEAKAEKAVQQ